MHGIEKNAEVGGELSAQMRQHICLNCEFV
jgi:hypothetical protein